MLLNGRLVVLAFEQMVGLGLLGFEVKRESMANKGLIVD